MANKPNIRFKGFTDDWEQRKLGGWGEFYYGRSCPKWSVTEDAITPCVRYGELYTKFGSKIDEIYSYTNMPVDNLRFSKGNEVLIPRVGEDPMDYNHCTWLSIPGVAIGEMISVFNTTQSPLFSAIMFNATLQREFAMRVEGGSVTNLYYDKLKNIDVLYPTMEEQKEIARYFSTLDHLITLHQRKCDETKKLKKFMLQKMFPKNGEKNPEIRFAGFTDDWEQRKLGEMSNSYSGGTPKVGTSKYYGGKIPFIRSAEINSDTTELFLTEEGLKCSSARLVDTGDILYALYGATSGEVGRARIKGAINQAILVIKPQAGYDYEFLTQWLRKSKLNIIDRYLQGGQGNLSGTIVNELLVEFPNYEEQTKIGTYFSTLDHLITLHQRKCDKLKLIKKFKLQNMFPKKG